MRTALLAVAVLMASSALAQDISGSPAPIRRPIVSGNMVYDNVTRAPLLARGYQELQTAFDPTTDPQEIKSQGLNFVRFVPRWRNDSAGLCVVDGQPAPIPPPPGAYPVAKDMYNPPYDAVQAPNGSGTPQNGYLTSAGIALMDSAVQGYTAQGLWLALGVNANQCDFYVNPVIQAQFDAMWTFVVTRYQGNPLIYCWEVMAEPNPPGDQFDQVVTNIMYRAAIAAIRAVDKLTPVCHGSVKNYDPRSYFAGSVLAIGPALPEQSNDIYLSNFYELCFGVTLGGGYCKEVQATPGAPPFNGPYTGYPGVYSDPRINWPSSSCTYPNEGGTPNMTPQWLYGLQGCLRQFQSWYNVPITISGFGLPSLTPGAWQWTKDMTTNFNTDGFGWAYNDYHGFATGLGINDGQNGPDSGDDQVKYIGNDGAWHLKGSTYSCPPINYGTGYGTSTCDDWIDMLSTQGNAP
jgi:hypothetical protein